MKNVNTKLTKYNDYILDLYEKKKQQQIDIEEYPIYDQYDYDEHVKNERPLDLHKRYVDYKLSDEEELNLLRDKVIYNNLKGQDILEMLEPKQLDMNNYPGLANTFAKCNFSSALDTNLEFYFHSQSDQDLLNVANLKKLCKWDLVMTKSVNFNSNCFISLPRFIQLLNNRENCEDIDETDVEHMRNISRACHRLESNDVLFAFAETQNQNSKILKLIDKKKPLNQFLTYVNLDQYLCSYKNLMYLMYEFLIDKNFLSSQKVHYSSLVISNQNKTFTNDDLFKYYYRNYHGSNFNLSDIDGIELNAINLAGIRMEAAMRVIGAEMMLIAVAITFIVIVTLVYLRSVFISFIVNLGVVVSFGIAFFFYRIVFNIVLFPFLNMMAAFLLIGIACDNVYVLFDCWYTEKAKVIMEDLPDQIEEYGKQDQALLANARPLPTVFIKKKFYKTKNLDPNSDMPELYRELSQKGI